MIIVSACLAGFGCRYDGKTKADPKIVELVRQGLAIPVCPEQLGGLPTPRPPAELSCDEQRVINAEGTDVTAQFVHGAQQVLTICRLYGASKAILKARSPSCGKGTIYDGSFSGSLRCGNGLTARLLMDNGIEIETAD